MPTTPELNEAAEGGSHHPLVVRLHDCRKRIGAMCSEGRGPSMSIPARPEVDDDLVICQTLDDACEGITKLLASLKRLDGHMIGNEVYEFAWVNYPERPEKSPSSYVREILLHNVRPLAPADTQTPTDQENV